MPRNRKYNKARRQTRAAARLARQRTVQGPDLNATQLTVLRQAAVAGPREGCDIVTGHSVKCKTHEYSDPCTGREWAVYGDLIDETENWIGGGVLAWAYDEGDAHVIMAQLRQCRLVLHDSLSVGRWINS